MRKISSNTGSHRGDIVERKRGHKAGGVELHEKGEGLADTAGGTDNADAIVALLLSGDSRLG